MLERLAKDPVLNQTHKRIFQNADGGIDRRKTKPTYRSPSSGPDMFRTLCLPHSLTAESYFSDIKCGNGLGEALRRPKNIEKVVSVKGFLTKFIFSTALAVEPRGRGLRPVLILTGWVRGASSGWGFERPGLVSH